MARDGIELASSPAKLLRKSQFRTALLADSKKRNSGLPYPQIPFSAELTLPSGGRRVGNQKAAFSLWQCIRGGLHGSRQKSNSRSFGSVWRKERAKHSSG
jgi:hypothetical protein